MKRRMRTTDRRIAGLLLLVLGACNERGAGDAASAPNAVPECHILRRDVVLDHAMRETSGAAFDPRDREVVLTHNDSGHEAELFAFARDGRTLARLRVTGAKNQDWEDLDAGPCPDGGSCLYVADIGDSDRKRRDPLELYRLPLPDLGAARTDSAERFRARFPEGNRDTEAVFVLPDGSVYLVNKGQKHPIDLWRWPTPLAGGTAELERVRTLAPEPRQPGDRVTGASASPDGRWVAIRTYGRLAFYRTPELLGGGGPAFTMELALLGEPQGEAVALHDDGTVVLTSESGSQGFPPKASFLRCELD
jgi:hypothetical protein